MTWLIRLIVLNSIQSCVFAFLGIVMNIDFSSSVGIYPVLYIILQSFVIAFTLRSSRAFNISVDISSDPVAFTIFH